MLATLNLQFSSLELLDDTSLTPLSLAPGDGREVSADFSNLLRLRVDASLHATDAAGQLLPPGGSELPLSANAATPESLTGLPSLEPNLIKLAPASLDTSDLAADVDAAELVLEAPVQYPPIAEAGPNQELPILTLQPAAGSGLPASAAQPSAAVGERAASLQDIAVDPRLRPGSLATGLPSSPTPAPVLDGRVVGAQTPFAETGVATPASLGLRERGQPGEPAARTPRISETNTIASTAAKAADNAQPADSLRQLGLMALQRADARYDNGGDMPQPRIALPQGGATLPTPTNPQPVQPSLAPPTVSAASADLSYAAAGQQSTDLIGISVRNSAWGEQLGDRVVMMAGNQVKQAEIRLTPAELGPLRVQLSVDDGAAHVTFHAQHAVTRDALEQALPRLREMLAENGLSLGQADVSERGVGEGGRESESQAGASSESNADRSEDLDIDGGRESLRPRPAANGLVDTFV